MTTPNPDEARALLEQAGRLGSAARSGAGWPHIALLLGLGGLFDNAWFFVAAPVAAFATDRLAIRREERHLTALFGPAWSAYADRVDRWFGRRMPSQSP